MRSVLIVDDSEAEAIALGRRLASEGWWAMTRSDGSAALAALSTRPFDLVIADVVMEGTVGTALLEAIRATPDRYLMPVVFMSAMPERRVRSLIDGDYAFVRKPFTAGELTTAINLASLRGLIGPAPARHRQERIRA